MVMVERRGVVATNSSAVQESTGVKRLLNVVCDDRGSKILKLTSRKGFCELGLSVDYGRRRTQAPELLALTLKKN